MQEIVLKHKEAFKQVLASYKVSQHAREILQDIEYVVLIGPAAGGRNTLISYLVENKNYKQIVSDTTRPPKLRDGKMEENGVNYFFRTEEDILDDLQNGKFLEAELIHDQQVSGTSIRELEHAKSKGQVAINETEYGGAKNVLSVKPNTTVIAILPPSFEIWKKRFESREEITEKEFQNRVRTALKVIELIKDDSRIKVVINDEIDRAADDIDAIVRHQSRSEEIENTTKLVVADFDTNLRQLIADFEV